MKQFIATLKGDGATAAKDTKETKAQALDKAA
jgi:hypothetical protein